MRLSAMLFVSLLTGCASTSPPPLGVNNPGSPLAPEASVRPMHNQLEADSITKKSRQILTGAAGDQ
jgi:hypothetical protein